MSAASSKKALKELTKVLVNRRKGFLEELFTGAIELLEGGLECGKGTFEVDLLVL